MSILNINLNDVNLVEKYPEYVKYDEELKNKYGEIHTPYRFIGEILSTIPIEYAKKKDSCIHIHNVCTHALQALTTILRMKGTESTSWSWETVAFRSPRGENGGSMSSLV